MIGGLVIIGIGVGLLTSNKGENKTEISSTSTAASTASKSSISTNKVRDLCYVYWDGIRWKEGKTEGDDFRRYSRAKYGVELVEISIPQVMTDSLGLTRSESGEAEDSQELKKFLDKYWYQIESLCDFY